MDEAKKQRLTKMQEALRQSAFTLALAKNHDNPEVLAVVEQIDLIQERLRVIEGEAQNLQNELRVRQTTLQTVLKPFVDKELDGIEKIG